MSDHQYSTSDEAGFSSIKVDHNGIPDTGITIMHPNELGRFNEASADKLDDLQKKESLKTEIKNMKDEVKHPTQDDKFRLNLIHIMQNPTGKGSAHLAARKMILQALDMKFAQLIKAHGAFKFKIYKDGNKYYFHVKVPSESSERISYDVVLLFVPHELSLVSSATINDYTLFIYSNSPSFTFTYAYVCNNVTKTLVPLMKEKCSRRSLKERPSVRNPDEEYGFEKSIYFAARFIKSYGLNIKQSMSEFIRPYNKNTLMHSVRHSEDMLALYSKMKSVERKAKQKEKSVAKKNTKKK